MPIPSVNVPGDWPKQAYQGDTFIWTFSITEDDTPVDLTGVVITMTIKKVRGATAPTLWSGTTTGGEIVVSGASDNVVTITIDATDTADIPAGSWVYDVQFVDTNDDVFTYLSSSFVITAEVTS